MSEEHWSWKQRTVLSVNADLQATKKYTRSYCDHLDERVTALEWKVNVLGSLLFLAGAYLFWHKTSIQTNHATIG